MSQQFSEMLALPTSPFSGWAVSECSLPHRVDDARRVISLRSMRSRKAYFQCVLSLEEWRPCQMAQQSLIARVSSQSLYSTAVASPSPITHHSCFRNPSPHVLRSEVVHGEVDFGMGHEGLLRDSTSCRGPRCRPFTISCWLHPRLMLETLFAGGFLRLLTMLNWRPWQREVQSLSVSLTVDQMCVCLQGGRLLVCVSGVVECSLLVSGRQV